MCSVLYNIVDGYDYYEVRSPTTSSIIYYVVFILKEWGYRAPIFGLFCAKKQNDVTALPWQR